MKLSVVVDVGFIDFFHLTSDYTILALFNILSIQTCFEIVHCVILYAVKCVRVCVSHCDIVRVSSLSYC